jgi:hypothetical protein
VKVLSFSQIIWASFGCEKVGDTDASLCYLIENITAYSSADNEMEACYSKLKP